MRGAISDVFGADGSEMVGGQRRTVKRNTEGRARENEGGGTGRGGAYSFFAYLSGLTIDHASLSGRSTVPSTVPIPNGDTSDTWGAHYVVSIHLYRNV